MTITMVSPEVAEELEAAQKARAEGEAAYLRTMARIVNWATVTVGDRGFDWNVEVPASKMHDVTQKLVDLEYDVEARRHVRFRTYAMAVPD